VYQALQEAGIEPDWIIGTSIGAIKASLIAGNEPQYRPKRLHAFCSRVQRDRTGLSGPVPWTRLGARWPRAFPAFSRRTRLPMPGMPFHLAPTAPATTRRRRSNKLSPELVNFDLINRGSPRLTVSAAHVRTSQMRYFDTRPQS
jgi:NTE family protein